MRCVNQSVWSRLRSSGAGMSIGSGLRRGALVLCAVGALAPGAAAQTLPDTPMARFITDLISAGARIDATVTNERTDFFVPAELAGITAQLNQSLATQLSTFPIDMGLGAARRGYESVPTQQGFSPSFSVHAGSLGRNKLSASFSYHNTSFESIDGIKLDSGLLGFVLTPPPATRAQFGRNVVQESLSLRIQQDTATLGLVYGVADRFDIGLGIPLVHLEMEGTVRSQVFRAPGAATADHYFFDVYPATPLQSTGCSASSVDITGVPRLPTSPKPNDTIVLYDMVELVSRNITRKCSASGIGDIAAHGRLRLVDTGSNALAASITARFPTGDADQLLGSGGTRTTASLVWSGRAGRFLPHANGGYTFSSGKGSALLNTVGNGVPSPTPLDLTLPNEIDIAAGTGIVFFDRLTLGADAFVRRVQNLTTFKVSDTTAPALSPGDGTVAGTLLQTNGNGATLAIGLASAQVALTDRTFLKADLMFPLFGDGLKPRVGFGAGLGFRY